MKNANKPAHTPGRCDLCGVKTKPGSQFEFMCRNSAACKQRRLVPDLLAAVKFLIDMVRVNDIAPSSADDSWDQWNEVLVLVAKAEAR